jgi:hypothetical protein
MLTWFVYYELIIQVLPTLLHVVCTLPLVRHAQRYEYDTTKRRYRQLLIDNQNSTATICTNINVAHELDAQLDGRLHNLLMKLCVALVDGKCEFLIRLYSMIIF